MPDGAAPDDQPLCTRARELADGRGPRPGDRDPDADLHADRVALLRRALASGEPDAAGLLATTHLERGDRRAAVEVLHPAVHGRDHAELAGLLGETLADLGDHDAAEDAFLVGVGLGDPGTLNDYGVYLRSRGRTQEAAHVLDRAARAGDDLAPLNLVSLHLEELDDPETATAIAERYADDDHPTNLIALAEVRLAAGRVDDAEELHRRAVELGGTCAHLWYGWFLLDRRDDPDGCERELRAAHDAGEAGAAVGLARFLHDAGRHDDALPLFLEAAMAGDAEAADVLEDNDNTFDRWDD